MAQLSRSIAASGKDSYEVSGTPSLTGTVVNGNGTSQYGAHVFDNIALAAADAANLISVFFQPYYTDASFDDPNLTLHLENAASPAALTTSTNDVSGRSRTTGVAWIATGVGTGYVNSPDLKTEMATVLGLGGWSSGNSVNVISRGTGSGNSRWATYDNGVGMPPKLEINYTAGGVAVKAVYYARMRAA